MPGKILIMALWLILAGPALAQEAAPAEGEAEAQTAGVEAEASPDQAEPPPLVSSWIDAEQRLVQTALVQGQSGRVSLMAFVEGTFGWLKSQSSYARTNSDLTDDDLILKELENADHYSLVVHGPREDNEDHWFIAVRYSHGKEKFHYDFYFAPEGDLMTLTEVREAETPLAGRKLTSLLEKIFGLASKAGK